MKKYVAWGFIVALVASVSVSRAQEAPELPAPQKEHEWLQQLVGEWESEFEAVPDPSQPPVKSKGSESARSIGGFWVVAENRGEFDGLEFTGLLTLGYDADKKRYIGTWVDSMQSYLWTYEGTVDADGKVLTLETEGPCPMRPGQTTNFREVLELKSKDHKVFTSSIQLEDGSWVTMLTINYRRKK